MTSKKSFFSTREEINVWKKGNLICIVWNAKFYIPLIAVSLSEVLSKLRGSSDVLYPSPLTSLMSSYSCRRKRRNYPGCVISVSWWHVWWLGRNSSCNRDQEAEMHLWLAKSKGFWRRWRCGRVVGVVVFLSFMVFFRSFEFFSHNFQTCQLFLGSKSFKTWWALHAIGSVWW